MQPWFLRFYRIFEVVLGGMFVCLAIAFMIFGGMRGDPNAPRMAIGALAVAALVVIIVEAKFASWRRLLSGIEHGLTAIGQKDLESAQPVARRGMEEVVEATVSNPSVGGAGRGLARMAAGNSVRLCVDGKWQGWDVEIGTVVSPGRTRDSKISYVCVRDRNVRRPFFAMTRGVGAGLTRMFFEQHPVTTGDESFDAKWVVDGDEAIAQDALDADTRGKLLQIESRVAWLRSANVQAMPYGLVVRWPGLLSSDGAAFLRDLALHIHERLVKPAA